MDGRYFKAVVYMRISKDSDKSNESESISNQRLYIYDYVKSFKDIEIVSEKIDDGYSGLNMDRPAFKEMLVSLREGKINCVIVKDLSRFSRNYIEACQYIENIFPFLGIRFISINDRYDSINTNEVNENLLMPFKSLLNASYSRDISVKTKSNLYAKRNKGEYLSAYAPYGYEKSKENKNKLIIDEYASKIVKQIFLSKINGKNNGEIAKVLNKNKILPPAAYKTFCKEKYKSGFSKAKKPNWTANIVGNILKNPVYKGTLIQGKYFIQDYKKNKAILKNQSEWIVTANAHEAVIPKNCFDLVKELLCEDTRLTDGRNKLYPFSGKLVCSECLGNMARKKINGKNKKYIYYVCINKENKKNGCKQKSINAIIFEQSYSIIMKKLLEIFFSDNICLFEDIKEEDFLQNRHLVSLFCKKAHVYKNNRTEIFLNFKNIFIH